MSISRRRETPFIAADGVRSLAMGYFSIDFVVIATSRGIGGFGIGLVTGLSVVVGILVTHAMVTFTNKVGSKLPMALFGVLLGLTGLSLLFSNSPTGIYIACLFGFLPPSGGLFISALVEGSLAQSDAVDRTKIFALDGMTVTASAALGALLAALPTIFSLGTLQGARLMMVLLVVLGIVLIGISFFLVDFVVPSFESKNWLGRQGDGNPKSARSSRFNIGLLTGLFAADSLGSGVITSTLVIYWLRVHFGFSVLALSALYFTMELISAFSLALAVRISARFGPLSTAVFTHIPSSILLLAVPFSPNGYLAVILLITRALLMKMDAPTRKSYMASIVDPDQRRLAASRTAIGRQSGRAIGPVIGGYMIAALGFESLFIVAAFLKIGYDLTLWYTFKSVFVRD